MLETYAPAAVVTNRQFAPLYFFGETDRYLQIVAGEPNQDLLSMAREGLRPKLRDTIAPLRGKRRIAAHGVWLKRENRTTAVTIETQRLSNGQGDLVLVSFIDEPQGLRNDLGPRRQAGRQYGAGAVTAAVDGYAQGTQSDDPRPSRGEPRAQSQERRGDVAQRGIPVHQ